MKTRQLPRRATSLPSVINTFIFVFCEWVAPCPKSTVKTKKINISLQIWWRNFRTVLHIINYCMHKGLRTEKKSKSVNENECELNVINYLRRRSFLVQSVCLSVCPSDNWKSCERILTKFFGGLGHDPRNDGFNFGDDPHRRPDPGVRSPKSGFNGFWILRSLSTSNENSWGT